MTHATILTVNKENETIEDGAVLFRGDTILDIGKTGDLLAKYPEEDQLECRDMIIAPGFVNVHYHGALSVTRGMGSDLGIPPLYAKHIPQGVMLSRDECYLFSLLGYAEALRAGSTCIGANYIYMDSHVQALADLGLRAVVSERLHDIDFFQVGDGRYVHDPQAGEETLQRNIDLIETWHGKRNGKITCHLGPHAPDTCTTPYLKRIVELARHYRVGMTTHLAQSRMETAELERRERMSPVRFYGEIGMLGPGTTAGHCIYVDDQDIELLAATKTNVAHVPEGNIKKADIAPIAKLERHGVNVALCTDAMTGSMPEAMRFAMVVHRLSSGSKHQPKPDRIVRMATAHGAKAMGLQHEIGSLEIGKKADLVAFDTNKYHLTPVISPAGTLVHSAVGTDVAHVWVDGVMRVKEGRVIGIDEEALCKEVQAAARACWNRVSGG